MKPELIRIIENHADTKEENSSDSFDPKPASSLSIHTDEGSGDDAEDEDAPQEPVNSNKDDPKVTSLRSVKEAAAPTVEGEIPEDIVINSKKLNPPPMPNELPIEHDQIIKQSSNTTPALHSGKGNRLYRGVVSKVSVVYLYEIKYPDGTKDVNIPFEALHTNKQGVASSVKVGSSVEALSWQERFCHVIPK